MKQVIKRRDDDGVGLRCHACDRLLARATEVTITVFDGPPLVGETSMVVDTDVPVGLHVDLVPGFVNVKMSHSSGLPWYGAPSTAEAPGCSDRCARGRMSRRHRRSVLAPQPAEAARWGYSDDAGGVIVQSTAAASAR